MSEAEPQQEAAPEPAEDEIRAYLEAHPDFLRRHPDLLETLEVPHDSGGAVSLIERQVETLRRGNQQAHARLEELIATARDNEWRVQHLNGLARLLISADSVAALVAGLRDFLHRELGVDALFIGIVADADALADGIRALPEGSQEAVAVDDVFRRGHPICGPLSEAQIQALFPDTDDTPPQSAALVPLGEDAVHGVLALGSRDAQRFVPDMGTLFLGLMGQLVTAACRRHVGGEVI